MRVGGRGSTAVLAPLLVLLAVTGKLAFLTLPKQELADGGAVALLQAAQRAPLDGELAHLLAERRTLAHEFADVTAAERRRQAAAQEKRALHARELRELDALRGVWRGVERQPATDSRDEAVARKIVHAEVEREERERTDGARAAAARLHHEQLAARRAAQVHMEAAAKREARRELQAAGVLRAPRKGASAHSVRTSAELRENEKNLALEQANARLREEARHMAVTLQLAPKPKPAVGPGGETGIGDPLSKAGVVEDSWGPITATADTRPGERKREIQPGRDRVARWKERMRFVRVTRTYTHAHADPRDSFAQRPARGHDGKFTGNLEGGREASAAVRASMAREALHVLPNMERRRKAAAAKSKLNAQALEHDLGFASSVLLDKTFDADLAQE